MEQLDPVKKCKLHCLRNETNKKVINLMQTDPYKVEIIDEFDRFI